jgi:hypothetical protein
MDDKLYTIEFTRPELISLMAGGLMTKMFLEEEEDKPKGKSKIQKENLDAALDKLLPVVIQANLDLKNDEERQAWLNKGDLQQ